MSRPINIDSATVSSGGQLTRETTVRSDDAAVQVSLSGSSTDVDVSLEARLTDALPWETYVQPDAWVGLSNGDATPPVIVDLGAIDEIRFVIDNQDGSNSATVTGTVITR